MGSQLLEILRQGVWASLTGGWFYDPHHDMFHNTFHLYLWLFLLCLPFTIYVYLDSNMYIWGMYCTSIAVVFSILKSLNMSLHHMYDTTECIIEEKEDDGIESERRRHPINKNVLREEEGIELQVLSGKSESETPRYSPRTSSIEATIGSEDSNESTDYNVASGPEPPASTIDLKVDVHRKNSSESSEGVFSVNAVVEKSGENETEQSKVKENQRGRSQEALVTEDTGAISRSSSGGARRRTSRHNSIDVTVDRQRSLYTSEYVVRGVRGVRLSSRRRYSNSYGVGFLMGSSDGDSSGSPIKPTGSLELGLTHNDSMPTVHKGLVYWKQRPNGGSTNCWRVARSGTNFQPTSLEGITNPEQQSMVLRNRLANHLCPYYRYGSEIVYPIAEQSDEHQASSSHGQDMLESDEEPAGSRSPLLVRGRTNSQWKDETFSTSCLEKVYQSVFQKHFGSEGEVLEGKRTKGKSNEDSEVDDMASSEGEWDTVTMGERRRKKRRLELLEKEDGVKELNKENIKSEEKEQICEGNAIGLSSEVPSLIGLDWLFEHTDSEVENKPPSRRPSDAVEPSVDSSTLGWSFTLSDDTTSDTSASPPYKGRLKRREDSGSSTNTTASADNEVTKLLSHEKVNHKSLRETSKRLSKPTNSCEKRKACGDNGTFAKDGEKRRHRRSREKDKGDGPSPVRGSSLDIPSCSSKSKGDDINNNSNEDHNPAQNGNNGTASSSGSNTELSSLLPPPATPLLALFLSTRALPTFNSLPPPPQTSGPTPHTTEPTDLKSRADGRSSRSRHRRLKRSSRTHRIARGPRDRPATQPSLPSTSQASTSHPPSTSVQLATLIGGTHFASSHDDTTNGSVHIFKDENGQWMTYTFDEKGLGTANSGRPTPGTRKLLNSLLRRNNSQSETCWLDNWEWQCPESLSNSSVSMDSLCVSNPPSSQSGPSPVRLLPTIPSQSSASYSQLHHLHQSSNGVYILETVSPQVVGHQNRSAFHHMLSETLAERYAQSRSWSHQLTSGAVMMHNSSGVEESPVIPVPPPSSSQGETDQCDVIFPRRCLRFSDSVEIPECPKMPRRYYKYKISPCSYIKIRLDRLALLALLDRNLTWTEAFLSLFLAISVSCLGSVLLHLDFYKDIHAFIFCFVIASCQYSLIKSVQPDAASPTHGFNRIIAFSRPVYFCLSSALVLLLHFIITTTELNAFTLYGMYIQTGDVFRVARDSLAVLILCFPILFSLGLFPQVNTFAMYVLEQVDMHIFGGNATSSLSAALYCVFRSCLAVILLYGFAYGGLSETKLAQHILFSIFCGLIVATSYHLSRSSSDPAPIWNILKTHLLPIEEEFHQTHVKKSEGRKKVSSQKKDKKNQCQKIRSVQIQIADKKQNQDNNDVNNQDKETELIDPLPAKLQNTINARLKSDLIICTLMAVLVFGIHCSTIFTALQPELNPVSKS
uniref:Pecanex-like protein n=1 Tax=Clastoptera arizonana TaxID=38151 RepID=A0A1B6E3I5_9HEMI